MLTLPPLWSRYRYISLDDVTNVAIGIVCVGVKPRKAHTHKTKQTKLLKKLSFWRERVTKTSNVLHTFEEDNCLPHM